MKKLTIYSIDYWIKRGFSDEESIIQVNKSKKETSCWCKEFWIKKGLSEEEAISKLKEKQKENTKKQNKKELKNVYLKETWIEKGFTEEEANNKINELKSKCSINSLNKDKIIEIKNKRRKTFYSKTKDEREKINKSKGITKVQLIEKYGLEKATEICNKKAVNKNNLYRRYSKISEKLFIDIQKKFSEKLYFGKEEKWIRYNKNKGFYVDLLYNTKIIEFNGNFFHANPLFYDNDSKIQISKTKILTAKEIWNKDKFKIDTLSKLGYSIMIVWESDLKEYENTLQTCINFLRNE